MSEMTRRDYYICAAMTGYLANRASLAPRASDGPACERTYTTKHGTTATIKASWNMPDSNVSAWTVATADALLAAAGDREAREPRPGEIDRAYLAQHNDALAGALETAIARAEAAEAKVAELEAKLAAAARLASDSAEAAGEMVGRPTANDRAVERIKAWADGMAKEQCACCQCAGNDVLVIINEEAERE